MVHSEKILEVGSHLSVDVTNCHKSRKGRKRLETATLKHYVNCVVIAIKKVK